MVDSSLNDPVVVQATRLDASILPRNIFSQSYLLYVINQGADVGAIAGKANQAGQGAYDACVKTMNRTPNWLITTQESPQTQKR